MNTIWGVCIVGFVYAATLRKIGIILQWRFVVGVAFYQAFSRLVD